MPPPISRRTLITGSLSGIATLASGFWIFRQREYDCVDVIVVGGGNAGMSAALAAAKTGASVLLIDQGPAPGVSMHSDLGLFASSASPDGTPISGDSIEQHITDSLDAAGPDNVNPELVRAIFSKAPQTLQHLTQLGMTFAPTPILSSSLRPRCWQPVNAGYIETLYRAAKTRGVRFRFSERVTSLHVTQDQVTGVSTRAPDGTISHWQAKLGVILATGGFGANRKLIAQYRPELRHLKTDNQPGADGSALLLARNIGAALIGMENIQCIPRAPGNLHTQGYLHLNAARFIYCDSQGRRFVPEDAPRDQVQQAFLSNPYHPIYEIGDNTTVTQSQIDIQKDLWRGIEEGTVFKTDTLEELAAKISVPAAALSDTLAHYNAAVETQSDPLGKSPRGLTAKLDKAPFWAVHVEMTIHETLGGLRVTPTGAVLDTNNCPIRGLFAAGAITGGIHGKCRLGGNGIASAITLGAIAGRCAGGNLS